MDSYKNHFLFGIAFEIPFIIGMYIWKNWYFNFKFLFVFQLLVIIVISPLIIDLDHRHGKLREAVTFLGLVISLVGVAGYYFTIDLNILMVFGIIIASAAHLTFYITKHRGFLHSIPFCILYGGMVYYILESYQLGLLAILGSYTHLMADKLFIKFI